MSKQKTSKGGGIDFYLLKQHFGVSIDPSYTPFWLGVDHREIRIYLPTCSKIARR